MCTNCMDIVTGGGSATGRRWFINRTDDLITSAPDESSFKNEFFEMLNELVGEEDHPNEVALNSIVTWLLQDPEIRQHVKTYRRKVRRLGAIQTDGSINQRLYIEARNDPVRYWVILAAKRGAITWVKQNYQNSKIEFETYWPSPRDGATFAEVHADDVFKAYREYKGDSHMGRKMPTNDVDFKDKFASYTGLERKEDFFLFGKNSLQLVRSNLEKSIPGLKISRIFDESAEQKEALEIWNEVKEKGSIWKSEKFLKRFPQQDKENPGAEVDAVLKAGITALQKKYKTTLLTPEECDEDCESMCSELSQSTPTSNPPSPQFIPDPQFPEIAVETRLLTHKRRRMENSEDDRERLFNEQYGGGDEDEEEENSGQGEDLMDE